MAETVSNFTNWLKNNYQDRIQKNFLSSSYMLMKMKKLNAKEFAGDYSGGAVIVPIQTAFNQGGGARGDNQTLPTAGTIQKATASVDIKYQYWTIDLTGPTIARSKSNKGAFVRAVSYAVKDAEEAMIDDCDRQLFGDGTGALAYLPSAQNTTNPTVTHAWDDNHRDAFTTGTQNHCRVGMQVAVVATDNSTFRTSTDTTALEVTAVTDTTTTVGTTALTSTAEGDYFLRFGVNSSGTLLEWVGLRGIISDSNPPGSSAYLNINRSTAGNEYWQAVAVDTNTAARSLTRELLQKGVTNVRTNQNGKCDLIITSYGIRDKYITNEAESKRHVNTMKLDGGFRGIPEAQFEAVEFNGIPLVPEVYSSPNIVYFLDSRTYGMMTLEDMFFADSKYGGGNMFQRLETTDSYRAILAYYATPVSLAPGKSAFLDYITEA